MNNVVHFFKILWPFLITLILWRLSVSFWNPAGILALIPIFFYSFVKPVDWFPAFGLLICFLIDYRCNLPLFWTIMYCFFYAVNGFQNYIDLEHMNKNALYLFMVFVSVGFCMLTFTYLTWNGLLNNIWLFIWISILYTPITALDKWIKR